VRTADRNSSIREKEVDRLQAPVVIEDGQTGAVRGQCFYPDNLRHQPPQFDRSVPRKSLKNQETWTNSQRRSLRLRPGHRG
jgi:hypothetical protein